MGAVGQGAVKAVPVVWVERKSFEHACDVCGWAGQPVREMVVEGEVMGTACVNEEECEEGRRVAAYMDERKVEEWESEQSGRG